jgi:hypothetical protein
VERHSSHFAEAKGRTDGSKSLEEISRSSEEPLDLAEVQGSYSGNMERILSSGGQTVDPSRSGPLYYSRDRLSGSREKSTNGSREADASYSTVRSVWDHEGEWKTSGESCELGVRR